MLKMKDQMIEIAGKKYEVIDAKERMTVPDCFVLKNKIGIGHGEAKFYVGNDNQETRNFFDNFSRKCIFLKSDFIRYLEDARIEYKEPQQPYRRKSKLSEDWNNYWDEINSNKEEVLFFRIEEQTQLKGTRVYINSKNNVYKLVRKISLPKVTYISALKLKSESDEIIYYFRLFLDYFGEEEHPSIINEKVEEIEKSEDIEETKKEQIKRARKGQGEYREKLLKECPFCPITLITDDRLLIASHIKPWVKSDNIEKTDTKNGFMFTPTYDFLFDRGFITFENDKTVTISPWLSKMTISKLNLVPGKKCTHLPVEGRERYLDYHRENIFKK